MYHGVDRRITSVGVCVAPDTKPLLTRAIGYKIFLFSSPFFRSKRHRFLPPHEITRGWGYNPFTPHFTKLFLFFVKILNQIINGWLSNEKTLLI